MIENFRGWRGQKWVLLELTVSKEWTNGINLFFTCWYRFTRIKSLSKMFWVGMVKNWCGQSGHKTLKLTLSQKWPDRINWFFCMLVQIQKKEKLIQKLMGGPCQKWPWPFSSWDTKISGILRMNLWIELIFWMLIMMQWFLVRLIFYFLTFKMPCSTAVVLLFFNIATAGSSFCIIDFIHRICFSSLVLIFADSSLRKHKRWTFASSIVFRTMLVRECRRRCK